ncbi:MAG TPA: cation-transporting P-type ATPase [Candidatus Saccharimonadales bacterium]|nr:cation-transporting P-type ATPase [Candidatus Saccharimonadales bacterium]
MEKPKTPTYTLSISDVLAEFHTTKNGLTSHEVVRRQKQFGLNALPVHRTPLWKRIIEPFASVFVGVLLFALVLSVVEGHVTDGIIIAVIVIVNAFIFYAQQFSVERALKTLQNHDVTKVPVLRDGQTAQLASEELTYGDIVHLSEGMKVPADGRIIEASQLQCDEAILTGESLPVHKHAAALTGETPIYNQKNMTFKGTYIHSGSGLLLVTGIGQDTQLGQITSLAAKADNTRSPIEHKIDSLMQRLIIIISIAAVITLALAMYRGVAWDEAVRFALAIIVSAIPEGLPIALTIVLLLSARRMAKVNALVKKMSSIETMGAITLIATDKTGTITQNKLSIADKHTTHPSADTFDQVIRASLNSSGDHKSDPLDALLSETSSHAHIPGSWQKVHDFPFDQDLRMSGVVWKREHDYLLVVKGAPESIIEHCHIRHKTDNAVSDALAEFTRNGYRTIAFAHKSLSKAPEKMSHETLDGLGLDGFVGMSDQLRHGVAQAVADARHAGIKVVMLTGDHVATAGFIAQKVGISEGPNDVTDSAVLQSGNLEDIRQSLEHTKVFGRVLPEHKYALLEATKGHEITAMTGDGVNDIPALVRADAGIAMGSSADAARDASDMVLLDDNFHTIVAAIRAGRTALANVRKMIMYLLGTSMGEVLTMITALALNMPLPVAAVQILWINLVTDGATVIPLGLSPAEPRQMAEPPRSPRAPLLDTRQFTRILTMGVTMAAAVLTVYQLNLHHGHAYAQTLAFLGLIVAQWSNALNANFEYKSWLYNFIQPNFKLILAIGGSFVIQLLVFMGPLGPFLSVVPVQLPDALLAAAIPGLAVLLAVDLHKFVFYLIRKAKTS